MATLSFLWSLGSMVPHTHSSLICVFVRCVSALSTRQEEPSLMAVPYICVIFKVLCSFKVEVKEELL